MVFRFSALGDVAMTAPILNLVTKQHPDLQLSVVSNPFMAPLFHGIDRLRFYGADTKKEFKGLRGLYRLSRDLRAELPYDAIADLHDVVRTKAIRFFLGSKPIAVIDKGRQEKRELTRPINKHLRPLKTTFQRYADVFAKLERPVELITEEGICKPPAMSIQHPAIGYTRVIGVAPFAKHAAKMYSLEKMKEVVGMLASEPDIKILLLGSRSEAPILESWEREWANVASLAGKYSFQDELAIIGSLDLMLSMDSANMHLASMYGVPVVSIWGGTHPYLGFYGWGQSLENAIQVDLPCRPSSVFGNKPCPVHGATGCMEGITPLLVVDRVKVALASSKRSAINP